MESKRDGSVRVRPQRTSERLQQRGKFYPRHYMYYTTAMGKNMKSKRRTTASQIATKLMCPRAQQRAQVHDVDAVSNLRRSTRTRKLLINSEGYDTNSSGTEDGDLMTPTYRRSTSKVENNANHDEVSASLRNKRILANKFLPRREGLRPRRSSVIGRTQVYQESEEQETSEEQIAKHDASNGKDIEDDEEEEIDGDDETEEDMDDEDGEEEQDGRRRYDLRNRAEVRRLSPGKVGKQRPRSPRRVLHHDISTKNKYLRKGGARAHKRHRPSLPDDSDDSFLVDEMDQSSAIPWTRNFNRGGMSWSMGGLDIQGTTALSLNVAASGWGHQDEGSNVLITGAQTAGPSSKGGADIQPLQVDENVSFEDIGGLSEYIMALKEMVFFPLLYPDFFEKYHMIPPRGVLLCGPPGTGKTSIARALACAASKAGQKVSFYMRKGADVLSKWVGEAERQLKLLFEEAQKNQPSIIFFDEIDGLAPVRSSRQEQIHNSIVSTLLALMDGLDSRGQVVLIGATNRIDAIDGALRRPGRFDREFIFPLPGYQARAEILGIHTRKWKDPPSQELKMELAASCVGYCGADLKALCTEAAIRAFREKYPQVYTSDDKFVIDVESITVEKYHFLEAMSTITPAAHRGSVVHSRPLSAIIAPCLQRHLRMIMEHISDIFPYLSALDVSKLSVFSYGSALPLVYKPRLLIYGEESSGLDHVGPAVLHELEKFPVHSLGLPSLISDPSAKAPEEALVHIFGEARRATPSILYLPQFHIWWENANEQLKAVLITLLEELPSNLPVLFIGTSSLPLSSMDGDCFAVFSPSNVYQVDDPIEYDRLVFVRKLVDTVCSIQLDELTNKSKKTTALPNLPKALKEAAGPKLSELKAKAETEQHALRRLRMCLRDVCNRILYDKKFNAFHYPVSDEEVPDYRSIIHNPMNIASILQHVDSGQYLTRASFLQDVDLIVSNAKTYNGDDYSGARIVSRAYELRDVVQGMLLQMDPALVTFCDKIAAQGGPLHVGDEIDGFTVPTVPVVQLASATRASARLRNVQPEVNLAQSFEALKRAKKRVDPDNTGLDRDESAADEMELPFQSVMQELDMNGSCREPESLDNHDIPVSSEMASSTPPFDDLLNSSIADAEFLSQTDTVKQRLLERTEGWGMPQLERLYTRVMKSVIEVICKPDYDRQMVLRHLFKFVEDDENF